MSLEGFNLKVMKRSGNLVNFDTNKIDMAISSCMRDTATGVDDIKTEICSDILKSIENREIVTVDEIQDMIETKLIQYGRSDAAREYIRYRNLRDKVRYKENNFKLLDKDFISKYKHLPNPMDSFGQFVYYRTYSRWIPEENRREQWWETCRRAVEYNCSLAPTTKEEAQELFDDMFNLRLFVSGRTMWVGGTEVVKKSKCANFNCAGEVLDELDCFYDLFYLLMVGAGVGVRVLREDVERLPLFRNDMKVIHEEYDPEIAILRCDNTALTFDDNIATITVGDSKEGWARSLLMFLELYSKSEYNNINTIVFNYNNVRNKGERLKTFGGTASGYGTLLQMFKKIDAVIRNAPDINDNDKVYKKLRPVDCIDICNLIGYNVCVGGVRRTAEITMIDSDDTESINMKSNLYVQKDGKWSINESISHRTMSNNSIYYTKKPSREQLHWHLERQRYSGEPGFVNAEAIVKRHDTAKCVNPCSEILLDSRGMCNLTTLNVCKFVDSNGKVMLNELLETQKRSARAGYRMTCMRMELPKWDNVQKRDRLLGCSFTGWQDFVNMTHISKEEQVEILNKMYEAAREGADTYADQLGTNRPKLVSTCKPSGTVSCLCGSSPGVHFSHSPYYIRRVRIVANDPLLKVCEKLGYTINIENGESEENYTTKVVDFPMKAPEGVTKYDVSAIDQLEIYKMMMNSYIDMNCSITISVKDNEWEDVEQWLWDNWDCVVGVSFLSLSNSFYNLMPYESISKEKYDELMKNFKVFEPNLIKQFEKNEIEIDTGNVECENGVCPVR